MIPEVPYLISRSHNEAPTSLAPGQQVAHLVEVQCMRPFLHPAKYLVEYCEQPGQPPIQLPFMLPAILTKFISPAEMPMQQFRHFFENFAGPPRENQVVGQAKVNPNQWPNFITKGFNLFMLPESNPTSAFGVGTFHTGTPDPAQPGKMMTVPCMIRLEYDPGRQAVRLIVRTSDGEVTKALSKIIESHLLVPSP